MRAAGSILKAHASRGRRAALIVNCARPAYQRVHSFDGDWHRALELLAAVEPDGHTPVATLLADEAGAAARALELTVVTSSPDAAPGGAAAQRAAGATARRSSTSTRRASNGRDTARCRTRRRRCSGSSARASPLPILRRGDDLAAKLGAAPAGAAVG